MHGANLSPVKSGLIEQSSINPELTYRAYLQQTCRVDVIVVKTNISYYNKERIIRKSLNKQVPSI